ncbi:hypothetical protein D3C86_1665390 [compost metagenome]
MAEVARQVHQPRMGVLGRQLLQLLQRAVAAAVVDVDDLEGLGQPREHRAQAPVQLRDDGFLVEDRDDDGNEHDGFPGAT